MQGVKNVKCATCGKSYDDDMDAAYACCLRVAEDHYITEIKVTLEDVPDLVEVN